MQDFSNSSVLAMELLQSSPKPSIYIYTLFNASGPLLLISRLNVYYLYHYCPRLQYLQCISSGDTAVLLWVVKLMLISWRSGDIYLFHCQWDIEGCTAKLCCLQYWSVIDTIVLLKDLKWSGVFLHFKSFNDWNNFSMDGTCEFVSVF